MNNRSTLYVIGLNQHHLIEIYNHTLYTQEGIILAICKVMHGIMRMRNATQFASLEDAKQALQEIKDNRISSLCHTGRCGSHAFLV